MHRWSRRTRSLLGAGAATLALAAVSATGAAAPATAAPAGHPATDHAQAALYRASASATLMHLASVATPSPAAFRGLRLGAAATQIDTTGRPQASAAAAYLSSTPWLDGAPTTTVMRRTGTGAPSSGTSIQRVAPIALPTLRIGSGLLKATANWGYPRSPMPLTSSTADLSRVVGYPVPGSALFGVRRGGTVYSSTDIVGVGGQRGLGVRATARSGLDTVTLFPGTHREITLRFLTRPALAATATGSYRSSVRYVAPVVAVSGPGGRAYSISSRRGVIEVPVAGFGAPMRWNGWGPNRAVVRISLGGLTKHVSPVSVRAEATALRVQIVDSSRPVLNLNLGEMDVAATAPPRGLTSLGSGGVTPADWRHRDANGPDTDESDDSDDPDGVIVTEDDPTEEPSVEPSQNVASPPPAETAAPVESPAPQEAAPSEAPQPDTAQPELPVTGSSVTLLIAVGVGLVGLGWLTRRKFRRRTR